MTSYIILSFIVAFFISLASVPIVSKITTDLGIIAQTNKRTIHQGIIPRTGGYAIYFSFLIATMIFLKTDTQINSMLIGGFIVFLTGYIDDMYDIKPMYKMTGQIAGALIVIFYGGISLKGFTLPLIPSSISYVLAIIITIGWIVGITNAINLIDGLDGLCAGISIIVLFTISMTSLTKGRTDIASLSLLLAGAIAGFLVYNFHPASVFMGDCGALFIGFMIAVISLLGFGYKTSTFFTLGAPIVVLMVPIMDTLIAIIRRKVHHKSFSEADRNHVHHKLMFKLELGQTKSVLVLYAATILFSLCSFLYINHPALALVLFIILLILVELFIEYTGMITRKYRPLLTLLNVFIKSDELPHIQDSKAYQRFLIRRKGVIIGVLVILIGVFGYGIYVSTDEKSESTSEVTFSYVESETSTSLMDDIYNKLSIAFNNEDKESEYQLVSAYFVSDYFTLSNKESGDVGGLDYFYEDRSEAFINYSYEDYYASLDSLIEEGSNTQEVISYEIVSYNFSDIVVEDLEDYNYYDVIVSIVFNEYNEITESEDLEVTVHLIEKDQKFSVIALDY